MKAVLIPHTVFVGDTAQYLVPLSDHEVYTLKQHNAVPETALPFTSIAENKTMTIKEVSEILGVSRDLIEKRVRELYPNKMKQGVKTLLNEIEVTAVKKRIEQNAHLATSDNCRKLAQMPKTHLEKQLLIRQAMQFQEEIIADLEAENERLKQTVQEQRPKIEYMDKLIERGNSTNIRNTAKELNIPERKFIKMLELDGLLYRDKKRQLLPYSKYQEKGLFELKEWHAGNKTGLQTLITVRGKEYLLGRYKGEV